MYETHDVNIGIVNDWGADFFFHLYFPLMETAFRELPRTKRV